MIFIGQSLTYHHEKHGRPLRALNGLQKCVSVCVWELSFSKYPPSARTTPKRKLYICIFGHSKLLVVVRVFGAYVVAAVIVFCCASHLHVNPRPHAHVQNNSSNKRFHEESGLCA